MFAADSSMSGVFNSRSFSAVADRPVLTIVALPYDIGGAENEDWRDYSRLTKLKLRFLV